MYVYKFGKDKNILLDGRSIIFLSKELKYNREHLSLILKGERHCTYELAKRIVNRLKPNGKVEDYFIKEED